MIASKEVFKFIFILLIIYDDAGVCIMVYVWRSDDNLVEYFLLLPLGSVN